MRNLLGALASLTAVFLAAPVSASVTQPSAVPMPFVMDAVPFTGGSSYEQGWRTVIKPIPVRLANIHVPGGKSTSGGTGINCNNGYAGDNGCTATKTAQQSNGTSIVPFWQDTNFVYNHATSGQVPVSSDPGYAAAVAVYSAFLHKGNYNIPYWDYAIGSANPTTLNAIDQFNVLNPLDTFCTYFPAGTGPKAGILPTVVNYINCSITSPTVTYTALQGFDWMYCSNITNCPGQATGHGNSTTALFVNVTSSANSPIIDKRNNRFGCATSCLNTGSPYFDYWLYTGNFIAADSYETVLDGWNDLPITTSIAGLNAHHVMFDSRTSTASVAGWGTTWSYLYIQGLSRDPSQGGNNGDFTTQYSVADGLGMDCSDHVEWNEQEGLGQKANYHYIGTMYIQHATQCSSPLLFDITSPQYGPGAGNGSTYGTLELGDNVNIVQQAGNCSLPPPYNADHQCGTGGTIGGEAGLLDLNKLTSVDTLLIYGNVVDDHIGIGVYANKFGQNGLGGLFSATASITSSGGQSQLNVYGLANGGNPQNWITPGSAISWLSGTAPAGWVDPAISNPNSGTNPSTLVGLAKFQMQWCNNTYPTACTATGTIMSGPVALNLVEHTAGFTCAANVAGCLIFTDTYGQVIGPVQGFAVSDNCSGVEPCASFNMSVTKNTAGLSNWHTDNYNDPAGAVGCQPGIFPNCGYFAFNIAEPVTAGPIPVGANTIVNYATVGAMTVSAPTYYATGATGTYTYTAPKTISFSDLTPGAQVRTTNGDIN